jgi:hypothetical protein
VPAKEVHQPLYVTHHQRPLPGGGGDITRFKRRNIVAINDDYGYKTEFLQVGHAPRDGVELGIGEWTLDFD